MSLQMHWWQRAVVYQIWVRSFLDSDADGVGDLPGLTSRLDYIQNLGAGAFWLSPIFPSPWADAGYDVSDFCAVHPRLGTLEDFDRLVGEAHRRGVRLILDWPINHTSDKHEWFEQARASRDSPYRNWYVWADAKPDGSPPNNWLSVFGGNAWTFDERTGQYYFHAFLPEQPDLNWRHPEVPVAMHAAMRFWLARGVDGFRVDAADMLLEDPDLPDNPPNPKFDPSGPPDAAVYQVYNRNQPGVHQQVAALRSICREFGERVLFGEAYTSLEELARYYGTDAQPELDLPLNPQLLQQPWDAEGIAHAITQYLETVAPHGWPCWTWSNHDFRRLTSRARGDQLRVAALLVLTLRGTPLIYYGEEIGMRDGEIPPQLAEDPQARTQPARNRDVARTPMQWSDGPQAGFSAAAPYFPVDKEYRHINVVSQERNPRSLLALYRRLIALRSAEPVLNAGSQSPVVCRPPLLFFRRELDGRALGVVVSMADAELAFDFSSVAPKARLLLSTFLDREGERLERDVCLRGNEGVVFVFERE